MFKVSPESKLLPENFGAGSIVTAGPFEAYLVVASAPKVVGLLNLQTFSRMPESVTAEDVNYLSESEARALVDANFPCYTFSDFSLQAKGLKEQRYKY